MIQQYNMETAFLAFITFLQRKVAGSTYKILIFYILKINKCIFIVIPLNDRWYVSYYYNKKRSVDLFSKMYV